MPKRRRLFQDEDYDDIPTPVSSKRPIEQSGVTTAQKVGRKDEEKKRQQRNDSESEGHSEAHTGDEDSDLQVLDDSCTKRNKKLKKRKSDSTFSKKSSDSHSSDDYVPQVKNMSSKSPKILSTKMPYSGEEDKMIVRFVMQYNRIRETSSVNLWKRLEKTSGLDGNFRKRPWQSLKNRFLRNIVPNLFTKFKHLLDEDNMKKALEKFPRLRDGMRKSQIEIEELLKEGRIRSERKMLNDLNQNGKSSEAENLEEIPKLPKNATSTPLKDIENKNSERLRQENNNLLASEFFNKSPVLKSKGNNDRVKKKIIHEIIRIEETSDEEESQLVDKTPEDLWQEFIDEQSQPNADIIEEETQLQGQPINDVVNLINSENSVPVNVDSEVIVVKNGPSQSLLFQELNKKIGENENDLKLNKLEGEVKKTIRLRKKRCEKPLHCYSIRDRLEFNQLLIRILKARKRKLSKLRKNKSKVKCRRKDNESRVSEEKNVKESDVELKGRESNEGESGELNRSENNKKLEGRGIDAEENRRESVGKENEDDQTKGKTSEREMGDEDGKKTEMKPENEVEFIEIKSYNMLEYYTSKALKHYEILIEDDSNSDCFEQIEKFANKMKTYSNSLNIKVENSASEDENNSILKCQNSSRENYLTANSEISANEKSNTSIEKSHLGSGLLGKMLSMLTEKEKKQV